MRAYWFMNITDWMGLPSLWVIRNKREWVMRFNQRATRNMHYDIRDEWKSQNATRYMIWLESAWLSSLSGKVTFCSQLVNFLIHIPSNCKLVWLSSLKKWQCYFFGICGYWKLVIKCTSNKWVSQKYGLICYVTHMLL